MELFIKGAVIAAMHRVGTFAHLGEREFQLELAWQLTEVRLDVENQIVWRSFRLGRELFSCLCEAQNWRCCYCGVRTNEYASNARHPCAPSLEHIVKFLLGGAEHPDNMVMACRRCNKKFFWLTAADVAAWVANEEYVPQRAAA